MTVVQTVDHERIIIGRIFREFNPEIKKTYYQAYDFAGNQIFGNGIDISELKNKFKKSGKFLADMVIGIRRAALQVNIRPRMNQNRSRVNDIKTIRDKKNDKDKGKTKDPEKEKVSEKTKLNQMGKEQDSKNPVQYKDLAHIIEGEMGNARSQEKTESTQNPENTDKANQEDHFQETEKSEREMELEGIRADNDDREQDIDEQDLDMDI